MKKNSAAAGLCNWVINIVDYHSVWRDVEPKRMKLQKSNEALAEANEQLAKVQKQVDELNAQLARLQTQFDKAEAEKKEAEEKAKNEAKEKAAAAAQEKAKAAASSDIRASYLLDPHPHGHPRKNLPPSPTAATAKMDRSSLWSSSTSRGREGLGTPSVTHRKDLSSAAGSGSGSGSTKRGGYPYAKNSASRLNFS